MGTPQRLDEKPNVGDKVEEMGTEEQRGRIRGRARWRKGREGEGKRKERKQEVDTHRRPPGVAPDLFAPSNSGKALCDFDAADAKIISICCSDMEGPCKAAGATDETNWA